MSNKGNLPDSKSLSIGIGIAGTCHTGKTTIALRLMNIFEAMGLKNIKITGHEMDEEELLEAREKADFGDLSEIVPANTQITISEIRLARGGVIGDADSIKPKAESQLTLEQLTARYGMGEHPSYPRKMWVNDVLGLNCIDGYWLWVSKQIHHAAYRRFEERCEKAKAEIDPADVGLTAEQLIEKYNGDGWGQHPTYTRDKWAMAINQGYRNTADGYWQWVAHMVASPTQAA